MKKQFYILAIIVSQLFFTFSYTSAYFYTSDSQFKSDLMDTIRDDKERQQQIDAQRALDRQIEDLRRQTDRDLQSNKDAIRGWSDNVDREMYQVEKDWERERVQKIEDKERQDFLNKVELDKALAKQKKEFEDGAEERSNERAKEYCITYDLEHITTGVSPELAALCAKRGVIMRTYDEVKEQNTEVVPVVQKVETVKRSNVSNTVLIKNQKASTSTGYKPYNYSQPKISTSTKKVTTGSFFDEYTSRGTSTPVVTNQQQKSVFNKLKDRFFRFF